MRIRFHHLGHQFDYAPIGLVLGAVVLLPNVFFNGPSWWLAALKLLLCVAFACWFFRCWWRGGHVSRWRLHPALLLFLLPILIALFQLLPLQQLSPSLAQARTTVSEILRCKMETRTLSSAPDNTWLRIELLTLCLGVFLLICARMNHRTLIRILFLGISFAALGNVIYAFANIFLNRSQGNFKDMVFHGMFLNRNHFGFLMVMGIFCVLGLLFSLRRHHRYKDRGEEYKPLYMRIKWTFLLMLELLVLLSGLFLSLSRGAVLGFAIGLFFFSCFAVPHAIRSHVIHRRTAIYVILFIAVMIFALPYSLERVASRFAKMEEIEGLDSRTHVWTQLLPAVKEYAWTGAGSGAFSAVCQKYYDGHTSFLVYAHNDYLEFLVEHGIFPSLLMIALMIWLWRKFLRRLKHQHEPVRRWCGLAGMSALTGCAVHEFMDYSLQAWANSLVFTALLAGIVLCSRSPNLHVQTEDRREIEDGRLGLRLSYLCMAGLCVALFFTGLWDLRSEIAFTRLQADLAEAVPFWQLGLSDDLQRVRWANTALQNTLRVRETLVARAKSKLNAAQRDVTRSKQWKQEAYMDLARALEMAPQDPAVANDCAYHLSASGMLAPEQSLQICEWAVQCQPTIAVTSTMAAQASIFYYMQAIRQNAPVAEEYRARMFKNMGVALANSPENKELYSMLTRTDASREELLAVAPPSFKIHKLLAECLLERRDLDGGLMMCERMRTDAANEEDEMKKQERLLEGVAMEMSILRQMDGQDEKLASLWKELESVLMAISEERMAKPLRERAKGRLRAAAEDIYAVSRKRPVATAVLLQSAKILAENGEWGRIPFILAGMLTAPGKVRPMAELQEALVLLEQADDLLPSARIRREFLEISLQIQMAEAGEKELPLEGFAQDLERLYRKNARDSREAWLQDHLLPLYAARAWLLAGNTVNAVSNLRLCLDICPDNGYAIQLLGGISLDYLTNRERYLFDWMKERSIPIAETSVGVRWIGVHHTPLALRPGELVRTTDFLFLVEHEMDQDLSSQLVFFNAAGQKLFNAKKPRVMHKNSSLTWRIGELIEFISEERFVKGPDQFYPPGKLYLQFRLSDFKKRSVQMWPDGLLPAGTIEATAEPEKED